jgi:hypothetical protein
MHTPIVPPSHEQANTDLLGGEQLLAMIQERGVNLPTELLEKARTVTAAYDENTQVLSSSDEERIDQAAQRQIENRDGIYATVRSETPGIIKERFDGPYSQWISSGEVAKHVRETLGIPRVSEHDLRRARLTSLGGAGRDDYALLQKQKAASDRVDKWSGEAAGWYTKPFREEAQSKADVYIAQKHDETTPEDIKQIARDTYDEEAEVKRTGLEGVLKTVTERIDTALSNLAQDSTRRLSRIALSKQKQWDRKVVQAANIRIVEDQLDTLMRQISQAASSRKQALRLKFPYEHGNLQKGIRDVTDEVYRKYLADLESGKLLEKYTEAVATALTKEGLSEAMLNRDRQSTEPSSNVSTTYSADVVKAVDAEIAAMRAKGSTDREIRVALARKYHPDTGNADGEEYLQYVSHIFRPAKTKTIA